MLYEVITEGRAAGDGLHPGLGDPAAVILMDVVQPAALAEIGGGQSGDGGAPGIEIAAIVITSYSIHYTKLYENGLKAIPRLPKGSTWINSYNFV